MHLPRPEQSFGQTRTSHPSPPQPRSHTHPFASHLPWTTSRDAHAGPANGFLHTHWPPTQASWRSGDVQSLGQRSVSQPAPV